MDQHQTPKNKDNEENTAYEDKPQQPLDMACQILTERKHISAINRREIQCCKSKMKQTQRRNTNRR